ncbi:MAG: hypothetical protein U0T85_01720 [Cloacibacterium normanense]
MATVEAAASVVEAVSAVDPKFNKVTDAVKDFPAVEVDVVNGGLTLTRRSCGRAS